MHRIALTVLKQWAWGWKLCSCWSAQYAECAAQEEPTPSKPAAHPKSPEASTPAEVCLYDICECLTRNCFLQRSWLNAKYVWQRLCAQHPSRTDVYMCPLAERFKNMLRGNRSQTGVDWGLKRMVLCRMARQLRPLRPRRQCRGARRPSASANRRRPCWTTTARAAPHLLWRSMVPHARAPSASAAFSCPSAAAPQMTVRILQPS